MKCQKGKQCIKKNPSSLPDSRPYCSGCDDKKRKSRPEVIEYIDPSDVTEAFSAFLQCYMGFRKGVGLDKRRVKNVHEILTGMTDKHGRICRYIKHQERKDPKSDWPKGMTQALTGYLVYAIMLLEHYKIDIEEGMAEELSEALKQHKK